MGNPLSMQPDRPTEMQPVRKASPLETPAVYLGEGNIISPLGFTIEENFQALLQSRTGIRPAAGIPSLEGYPAAQIAPSELARRTAGRLAGYSRAERLLILSVADTLARNRADLQDPDTLLILSTTKGNINRLGWGSAVFSDTPEEQPGGSPALPNDLCLWRTAQAVGNYFKAARKPRVISNACISGVSALIVARRLLLEGFCRSAIVAGCDVLSEFIASGFISFKSVSPQPCRPYDAEREGLTLGEACASILVTANRPETGDGRPRILLRGGAVTNDANHISGPSRTGDGLFYAIDQSLKESGLSPQEIDFVNAHGTATPYNDEMESKALRSAELSQTPLNSLKPYFGHTLGASGVLETLLCAEQLKENIIAGTPGFSRQGTPYPLSVTAGHRRRPLFRCLKTASGFGGCNAALVLEKEAPEQPSGAAGAEKISSSGSGIHRFAFLPERETLISEREEEFRNDPRLKILSECRIERGRALLNGEELLRAGGEAFGVFIRDLFKRYCAPNTKFYKMDDLCKLGYIAAELLLRERKFAPQEAALVMANRSASLDTDLRHQALLDDPQENVSPAVFVYTLPNLVLGEICIRHKIQGENTFFVSEKTPVRFLPRYAAAVLKYTPARLVLYGWCELLKERYSARFCLAELKESRG